MLPQNRPKRKRDAKVFMKDKLGFVELLAPQAHTFSRGEGAPGGGGCGIREITYDTVLRKDLRMGYALGGLIRLPCRCVSARIPHQSAARSSPADSFSPGEAIAARCAAVAPEGRHIPFPAAR